MPDTSPGTAAGQVSWSGVDRRQAQDRRRYDLATLWRALRSPRRMTGRRDADRIFPLLDRFDGGVVALGILLVCLSITDSVFTLTLIARGGNEVNPFMNTLLAHSVWTFVGVKMFLTAVPAILLVSAGNLKLCGRWRARSILAALVGMYVGLVIYEVGLLWASAPG